MQATSHKKNARPAALCVGAVPLQGFAKGHQAQIKGILEDVDDAMADEGVRQIRFPSLLQKLYMFLEIILPIHSCLPKHQTSNIKHQTYYNGFPAKKEAALLSGGDRAASR